MKSQLALDLKLPSKMPQDAKDRLYDCYTGLRSFQNISKIHEKDTNAFDLDSNKERVSQIIGTAFREGLSLGSDEGKSEYFKTLSKFLDAWSVGKLPRVNGKWLLVGNIALDLLHMREWPSNKEIIKRVSFYYESTTKGEVNKMAEAYGFIDMLADDRVSYGNQVS